MAETQVKASQSSSEGTSVVKLNKFKLKKYLVLAIFPITLFILYHLKIITIRSGFELQDEVQFTGDKPDGHGRSFQEEMKIFPWDVYSKSLEKKNNSAEIEMYSGLLLRKLVTFLIQHPAIPPNNSCRPPKLEMPKSPKCRPLQRPRKVGILLQFGFDVDSLEIHLNELDEVVDKFFLIESMTPTSTFIKSKPLLWDNLKYDQRFIKFSEKIIHFVVDYATIAKLDLNQMWSMERQQEELRWRKFQEWNKVTKYFQNDDILGFGDTDEVPNRNNVYFLKNCKLPSDPVDIGIWFPFGGIDTVYRTGWSVKGHPYTLGDPTFWTLGTASKYKGDGKGKLQKIIFMGKPFLHRVNVNVQNPPSRRRGKSKGYLLGGMHLSRYAYPPFQLTKMLTGSESRTGSVLRVIVIGKLFAEDKSAEAKEKLNGVRKKYDRNIKDMDTFVKSNKTEAESIVKVPWFLNCNRLRYPGFFKEDDLRLNTSFIKS